ncbi:MAG: acyl-CoA thioesterase [Paludibacteraceae bacterium]|nr:acyl-CoA thioesterase [Paludibacteraceae bacterium]
MKNPDFELKFKVRDYECDLQGIVNNANYQHYLEHTRHEFLLSRGISFADLHQRGIDAVIARIELNYKSPLRSRDEFVSQVRVETDGYKQIFHHEIIQIPENRVCVRAKAVNVCLVNGKLSRCEELCDQLTRKTS